VFNSTEKTLPICATTTSKHCYTLCHASQRSLRRCPGEQFVCACVYFVSLNSFSSHPLQHFGAIRFPMLILMYSETTLEQEWLTARTLL
jgi:hypothetical protein